MTTLYEDFVSTGGKWKNGIIYKTVTSKRKNSSLGCRKWLTCAQLLQHFNDDAEIVDAVILRKETDPELRGKEIREHPECPGNSPKLSNLTYTRAHVSFANLIIRLRPRIKAISRAGRRFGV